MTEKPYFVHESSYVDDGVIIGAHTKVWHFCHIMSNTEIGERCSFGQNCVVGPNVKIGNNVKVQNNISTKGMNGRPGGRGLEVFRDNIPVEIRYFFFKRSPKRILTAADAGKSQDHRNYRDNAVSIFRCSPFLFLQFSFNFSVIDPFEKGFE